MTTIDKLKELGYTTVAAEYYSKVQEWKSWYKGDVKSFHNYTVRTGHNSVRCKRYSLGMGKKVPEDWANLLMNEKVSVTLEGQREQEFIDRVFRENNFEVKANELVELAFAMGTGAIIPRVTGVEVERDGTADGTSATIAMDYVSVEHIFPLTWSNGKITECAFDRVLTVKDGSSYLYLQIHKRGKNGLYDIENHVYTYINEAAQTERPLASVPGFENVAPVVHTGIDRRQFVILRPNIANNYDQDIPLGISVFANAIDVLRGVDVAYDSYVNEFLLGKKRIMVKPQAANYLDGAPAFDPNDAIFYVLPEDLEDGMVVQAIDMQLRTAEHSTGIQDQLNMLSSKCGFGERHYKFDGGNIATATQVISENSTLYRTIKKHEIILESMLVELCRVLLRLGNEAMSAGLDEDVEIYIDFDDSIIEDKQQDFTRTLQLLSAGLINDWEARMALLNEDEETAKAALPKAQDLTQEPEEEIE